MLDLEARPAPWPEPALVRRDSPTPVQRLSHDDLRGLTISPAISPLPTVIALIGLALSDCDSSLRGPEVRRALVPRLRDGDLAVLRPLRTVVTRNGSGSCPNEIVPTLPDASMPELLDAIRMVDPDRLREGIAAGGLGGAWRGVAREPARWLSAYADAVHRAWDVLSPMWTRAAEVLDRHVERVRVAVAHEAQGELIAWLYPHSAVVADELWLPSHSERSGRIRVCKSLQLYPLLAPPSCARWVDDHADGCVAVHYSIGDTRRMLDRRAPASLSTLIGRPRAKILRRLERPATAGELAELLHGAPSMVTHHLRALESAGLITRTREGRNVWVRRTPRGSALAAMYEEG